MGEFGSQPVNRDWIPPGSFVIVGFRGNDNETDDENGIAFPADFGRHCV